MIFIFLFMFSQISFSKIDNEIILSYKISKNNSNIDKISDQFEIISKTKNMFLVYVLKEKRDKFIKLAPKALLISLDINKNLRSKNNFLNTYRTYKNVKEDINQLVSLYPTLTKSIKYGESKDGNPLIALRLTSSNKKIKNKNRIMLTAATHGDEIITVEVLFGLMESLLTKSVQSERFSNILEHNEIYFIPVVNPDGYKRRSRYAHRKDPNRAYPMKDGSRKYKSKVKCIEELMKFYNQMNFNGSIDFHASGKMIMFPWAHTKEKIISSDFDLFSKLTKKMAIANKYKHGQISKVIYIAKGSSVDYYYLKNQGLALAVELTTSKAPNPKKIDKIIKEASEMTWKYLESI